MAAEGRLDIAAKYARFPDLSCAILKDRIFHAAPIPGYQPPPFPFDVVQVHTHVQQQYQTVQQQVQQQHAQAQGYGNQPGYGTQYNTQAPAPVVVGGFGGAQAPSYQQQQPRAPSPAYPGRQTQPGYVQQPAATGYQATQQQGYSTPQQPAYGGEVTYPGHQQHQQGFSNQARQGGYPGHPGQQQPGFNRPQQPGFSGPPSTGAPNLASYSVPQQQQQQQPTVFNPNVAAQGTGVNSVAAAISMGSSRISKPSVDLVAQKKDGFSSSAGNAKLGNKYGNFTTALPSPSDTGPAKTFNPETATGSTENVSAQDLPIVTMFNDLFAQLQTLPLTMVRLSLVGACGSE